MTDLQSPPSIAPKPEKTSKHGEYEVWEVTTIEEVESTRMLTESGGRLPRGTKVLVSLGTQTGLDAQGARRKAMEAQATSEHDAGEYKSGRTYSANASTNREEWTPQPEVKLSWS